MTLSINHFDLRLVVEETSSEVNISYVYILWHVLSKCIRRILAIFEVIVNLAVHTLI